MRPSFLPRLVNGPFEDPGLFLPFLFEKRAILFDLGDIYSLSAKEILKASHVFITHTHMDHFIGFDRLLRLFLGRDQHLYLYGPEDFLKNVEGKLAGYSWDLVENYNNLLRCMFSKFTPITCSPENTSATTDSSPHRRSSNTRLAVFCIKKPLCLFLPKFSITVFPVSGLPSRKDSM
jgi:ribonuclease BN (tRNA processing enzyme)